MPAPLISRDEAIDRITGVFQLLGYEGPSLAALSSATGLVKASLYHHFPDGKKAMAVAALEKSAEQLHRLVIEPLKTQYPPTERLLAMLDGINEFYRGGTDLCLFAVLSIGDARELFFPYIAPHLQAWSEALVRTFIEKGTPTDQAERRAEQVLITIEGALIVARASRNVAVFGRALEWLRKDFCRP